MPAVGLYFCLFFVWLSLYEETSSQACCYPHCQYQVPSPRYKTSKREKDVRDAVTIHRKGSSPFPNIQHARRLDKADNNASASSTQTPFHTAHIQSLYHPASTAQVRNAPPIFSSPSQEDEQHPSQPQRPPRHQQAKMRQPSPTSGRGPFRSWSRASSAAASFPSSRAAPIWHCEWRSSMMSLMGRNLL
jgi:hypothetical protein